MSAWPFSVVVPGVGQCIKRKERKGEEVLVAKERRGVLGVFPEGVWLCDLDVQRGTYRTSSETGFQ